MRSGSAPMEAASPASKMAGSEPSRPPTACPTMSSRTSKRIRREISGSQRRAGSAVIRTGVSLALKRRADPPSADATPSARALLAACSCPRALRCSVSPTAALNRSADSSRKATDRLKGSPAPPMVRCGSDSATARSRTGRTAGPAHSRRNTAQPPKSRCSMKTPPGASGRFWGGRFTVCGTGDSNRCPWRMREPTSAPCTACMSIGKAASGLDSNPMD